MEKALDTSTASALDTAGLIARLGGFFVSSDSTETRSLALETAGLVAGLGDFFVSSDSTEPVVDRTIQRAVSLFDELTRIRKIKSIQEFLMRLKHRANEESFPSRHVADRVEKVWREAGERYGNLLPLPSMALGEDGGVLFVWRRDAHYLEIEVLPGGSEVFYENTQIGVAHHQDVSSGHSEVECAEPWFLRFIDQQAEAYGTAA